eukprot:1156355-Pelagomonas_calceolata.AAC.4
MGFKGVLQWHAAFLQLPRAPDQVQFHKQSSERDCRELLWHSATSQAPRASDQVRFYRHLKNTFSQTQHAWLTELGSGFAACLANTDAVHLLVHAKSHAHTVLIA